MKLIEITTSASTVLYHTTKLRYAQPILKSNTLLATSQSNGSRAVSLTRSKTYVRVYLERVNYVRFGLDKQLLGNTYKISPYSENENSKDGQFEEHVLGNIHPLSKYLLSVDVVLNEQIQENELDSYESLKLYQEPIEIGLR